MRTRFLQFLLALALCLVMAPVTASARGDRGKDKDNDRHADRDRDRDRDNDRDRDKDKDRDHRADRDRDRDRDHDRDNQARPAGWSKGKKTGWGNCNLPPGQAKKNGGCNNGRRDRDDRRVATANRGVRPANSATRRDANGRLIRRNALRKTTRTRNRLNRIADAKCPSPLGEGHFCFEELKRW